MAASDAVNVKQGIREALEQVEAAFVARPTHLRTAKPILVAVSKTKPIEMIADVYATGHRHFGENYVQELVDKAEQPDLRRQCPDIRWHLIGHLQSNKINKVLRIPGLHMIETIDSAKLASAVDAAWQRLRRPEQPVQLSVLVQVNTSGEAAKSGCEPAECVALCRHVRDQCPQLRFQGLMTIGAYGHDYAAGPNLDHVRMIECHRSVCDELQLADEDVHISMGMSNDFDRAIAAGSSMVRVGSSIFGYRAPKTAN